jgi:hypothetical protein
VPEHEPDDVLSQDEVNDLLSDLAGAEGNEEEQPGAAAETDEPGPAIRIYDFRRPDILSMDELQAFAADGRRIADAANRQFSALGVAQWSLELSSVDMLTLDEYIRTLSAPCFVVPFVYDSGSTVTVELAPSFAAPAAHAVMGLPAVGSPSLQSLPEVLRRALAVATTSAFADALAKNGRTPEPAQPLATPVELRSLAMGASICVMTFSGNRESPPLLATVAIGRPALETLWRTRAAKSDPTGSADVVLRRTLRFPVPGVAGSRLRTFLDTGELDVSDAAHGHVAYEEE